MVRRNCRRLSEFELMKLSLVFNKYSNIFQPTRYILQLDFQSGAINEAHSMATTEKVCIDCHPRSGFRSRHRIIHHECASKTFLKNCWFVNFNKITISRRTDKKLNDFQIKQIIALTADMIRNSLPWTMTERKLYSKNLFLICYI